MAEDKKKLARTAQEEMKKAGSHARSAGQIFRMIGDPDGEKVAKKIDDAATEGDKYVEKRVGGAQQGS